MGDESIAIERYPGNIAYGRYAGCMNLPVKTVEQLRDHLRSLRKAAGLTQKALGIRLGLGQVRVAEIEANPGSISTAQLLLVLQALGAEMAVQSRAAAPTGGPSRAAALTQPGSVQRVPGSSAVRNRFDDVHAELAERRFETLLNLTQAQSSAVVDGVRRVVDHDADHRVDAVLAVREPHGDSPLFKPVMVSAKGAEELAFWADKFGVTMEELHQALLAVGVEPILDAPPQTNRGSW